MYLIGYIQGDDTLIAPPSGGGPEHHTPDAGHAGVWADGHRGAGERNDQWSGRGGHGRDTDRCPTAHHPHAAQSGGREAHRLGEWTTGHIDWVSGQLDT